MKGNYNEKTGRNYNEVYNVTNIENAFHYNNSDQDNKLDKNS